jgi:hypothetical protein
VFYLVFFKGSKLSFRNLIFLTKQPPVAKEKNMIGELWEKQSKGKGLFLIVEKSKNGINTEKQIKTKIENNF